MTAPAVALDEAQADLLFAVQAGKVSYSRGCYRLRATGQPDVTSGVQHLRALGLVRLVEIADRSKIPPTRATELTDKGEQVAQAYA